MVLHRPVETARLFRAGGPHFVAPHLKRVHHISLLRCGCATAKPHCRSGRTLAPYPGNSVPPFFHRDPIDTARIIKEEPNSARVVSPHTGPDLEPVAPSGRS